MPYVMLTFGKTRKYYFLNRMKYIEGCLVKSGKISREQEKLLVRKKYILRKIGRKRCESNNLLHKHLLVKK